MGWQTENANTIIERGADYVLAAKDNQPKIHTEIREAFEQAMHDALEGKKPALHEHIERQKKRGRDEEHQSYMLPIRRSTVLGRRRAAKSIGMVIRRRTIKGCEQTEAHYYLSSMLLGVKRFARAARGHWGIEHRLHWSLDVIFAHDASRIRKSASPEIASMLRQPALMILQQGTQLKGSLTCKRKQAGWNNRRLEILLAQINAI